MFKPPPLVYLFVALAPFLAGRVLAYSSGISGYTGQHGANCNACHTGGQMPSVAFSGPATLSPGATGDFTFTVQSSAPEQQTAAGFNVAASGGTLRIASGQKEQIVSGELTHTQPKDNDTNGAASWAFKWKAPATSSNYVLYGAGNSVNRNGNPDGDRAASVVYFVAVGDVTPLPTWTPRLIVTSPTPSATPPPPSATPTSTQPSATGTPTSTATLTAPATPTWSQTPAPTDTPQPTDTAAPSATSTDTPLDQGTPAATDSPTATATLLPTGTATGAPSVSPTPVAQPGDANCDGLVTAADLPQLLRLLSINDAGPCGAADTDRSGSIDEFDVFATIDVIFEPRL